MSKFTWAARTAKFAVLTTVFAAGGTGVALAGSTTGSGGIASGNQVGHGLWERGRGGRRRDSRV
jgi:hypothetical protein